MIKNILIILINIVKNFKLFFYTMVYVHLKKIYTVIVIDYGTEIIITILLMIFHLIQGYLTATFIIPTFLNDIDSLSISFFSFFKLLRILIYYLLIVECPVTSIFFYIVLNYE